MTDISYIDANLDDVKTYGICGYKNFKRAGFPEKVDWVAREFENGLKVRFALSAQDGAQGMIEYLPGEVCWRPVEAAGTTFIHCLYVGFKNEYKGHGIASELLTQCEADARAAGHHGVSVVTRDGPFMARKDLFLKHGYELADKTPPDFELLVKRFDKSAPLPRFKGDWEARRRAYGDGLVILRADQCPYTVKNVNEMVAAAQAEFGISARVVDVKTWQEAQASPSPFGTFGILYRGELVAAHPISKARLMNILRKMQ